MGQGQKAGRGAAGAGSFAMVEGGRGPTLVPMHATPALPRAWLVSAASRVPTGAIHRPLAEDAQRELDRVLDAEIVFRGPADEGLEQGAIEMKAVEHDEAATSGDSGWHHAGRSRQESRGCC